MTFDNLLGSILSISICMQTFITIVHSVRPFPLFQNWSSAQPRPRINVISQSLELAVVNINVYAKFYQHIPNGLRVIDIFRELSGDKIFINRPVTFHFFRILRSAKHRPMINVISQSLGLDVVNINVYAKVYQHIPNCLRVIEIFRGLSGDKIFTNRQVTKSSQTVRWQNHFFFFIGHTLKVNLQFQFTFLWSCNWA